MVLTLAIGVAASVSTLTILHVMSGDPIPQKSDRLFVPLLDNGPLKGYTPGGEDSMDRQVSYPDAKNFLASKMGERRTAIEGVALAIRFVLFGLMGPFAAILMERFGLRAVVVTALSLVAGGMALATGMTHFWHLIVFWGVMLGVGSGMTALVLSAVVANRWFETHRGLVVGVLTASSATGQLLFLPVGAWLIEHFGWRTP